MPPVLNELNESGSIRGVLSYCRTREGILSPRNLNRYRARIGMQVLCPKCGQVIAGDDVNVVTDIARCQKCDEVFVLSSLVQSSSSGPVDVNDPPRGAWYQPEFNGFVVGATTRHPMAFFLVPFMCVWSGGSLGGIYGSQFFQSKFDLSMSLFGIPFVLGTLLFGSFALMTVCGKVVVSIRDADGVVFTGIGPIGWRRRFEPQQITTVRIEAYRQTDNPSSMTIVLDGAKKLRFGSMLTEPRRDFVANVLRQELPKGNQPRRGVA